MRLVLAQVAALAMSAYNKNAHVLSWLRLLRMPSRPDALFLPPEDIPDEALGVLARWGLHPPGPWTCVTSGDALYGACSHACVEGASTGSCACRAALRMRRVQTGRASGAPPPPPQAHPKCRYFAAIEPRERSTIEMVLPGRVIFLRPLKASPPHTGPATCCGGPPPWTLRLCWAA